MSVTATPAERAQPISAIHVTALDARLTPTNSPYDLLRQTAALEVHEQGQGPGFASDASLRGFSSDHATDVALRVDGVPINEPVNGHAEGYNDWSVVFPGGIQDIDVIRGPTSALFGNFALAGVVNVRTLERMRGTEITATGGSFGRADAIVMSGFDHGTDGGIIGGHYQRADEFAAHDYGIVSNPTDVGYKQRAQERVSLRVLTGNGIWRTTAYATQGRWQLFLTIPPAGGQFEGSGSQTEEEDSRAGEKVRTMNLPQTNAAFGRGPLRAHSNFRPPTSLKKELVC